MTQSSMGKEESGSVESGGVGDKKKSDILGVKRGAAISALFISEFCCSGAVDCSWGGFGTDVDELFSV